MPTYDYQCSDCAALFSEFLAISDRDLPLKTLCSCGGKIARAWINPPVGGVDRTLSPGADFKELINRITPTVPKRYRDGLQRSASLRGGRLGSQ